MNLTRKVLLAAALVAAPAVSHATLIWEATTSRGTGAFEGIEQSPGLISVVSDPKGQYGNVYRYNIWDNADGSKDRCESRGHKLLDGTNYQLTKGGTYYIGWRAMWDGNVGTQADKWVAVWQMHSYGITGAGAPLVLRTLGDGILHLQNNVEGTNDHIWNTTMRRNVWERFVVHVYIQPDTTAWVELWYNGVRQNFINGANRYNCPLADAEAGAYDKLKWGLYRTGSATGNWNAWMSRARIGTTFADVDPDGGTITPTPTPTPAATPTPGPTPTPCSTCGFSGYYRIMARHSGKAVVVEGASTSNSANVVQWSYGGANTNDEWQVSSIGSGYYRVINRLSGKDLTVQSASTSDGANIFQYAYGGASTNDEWAIVDVGSGYFRITNRNSGKSAEVAAGSTTDGANVDQRTYGGATYQQFQLVSVP
jgi:hypothetical protein